MQFLVSSLIAASLLLTPLSVPAKQIEGSNSNPSQSNLAENPAPCERVRITLNSGRKIDADSYKHHDGRVEITRKGINQALTDEDIKRVEVRQGTCPDVVVTLRSGEKVKGYLRDQTSDDRRDCGAEIKQEIRQKNGLLRIAASDIKDIHVKTTFVEKLTNIALIPLYPFAYLILAIACRNGCEDL